jgi:DNA-binding beta-propeller fold protein YncE
MLLPCMFYCFISGVRAQEKNGPYDAPDQITWHAASKSWFVSSLGGGISFARDHYGWISRLDATGRVTDSLWVKGLDAPSGMVATVTKLYVCDRAGILQIDIASAKVEQTYPLPGAEFINDIGIAANGDLYVSDFYGNKIYRIPANTRKAEVFVNIPDSPDGVYVDGEELMVVTWGKIINRKTFETSKKGQVLCINLRTKAIRPLLTNVDEIGNLEGITKVGDYYYVTEWMAGKLLRISKKNGVEEIMTGLKNPSDPDYSAELNTIAFPEHHGSRVLFLKPGHL